jgi:hypothetical protein
MVDIVREYEGVTKARLSTVLEKIEHCGFNNIVTHTLVHMVTLDKELTAKEQQEDSTDLQPVQPNSIYIKCIVLGSAKDYVGNGDINLLSKRRNTAPVMDKLAVKSGTDKPLKHSLPTESPIEEEYEKFPFDVEKDIIFVSPKEGEEIGWYNRNSNILWISDLTHNPHRAEVLLDQAISPVYEYQRCDSLDVILPIQKSFMKTLTDRGYSNTSLIWTGFEDAKSYTRIDGKLNSEKFFKEELDNLIKDGCDIFFLRSASQEGVCQLSVEKCKGKVTLSNPGEIKAPAHTSVEDEVKTMEAYLTKYTKNVAKEFHDLAKAELKTKRVR